MAESDVILLGSHHEAHAHLRAAAERLNLARAELDDLASLANGYAAKLLSDPPMRGFSFMSLWTLAGACGYAIALVPDPKALRRVQKAKKRDARKVRPNNQNRATALMRELCRTAARQRWERLTPDQRSREMSRVRKIQLWRRARTSRKKPSRRSSKKSALQKAFYAAMATPPDAMVKAMFVDRMASKIGVWK